MKTSIRKVYQACIQFDIHGASVNKAEKFTNIICNKALSFSGVDGLDVVTNSGGPCWDPYIEVEGESEVAVIEFVTIIEKLIENYRGGKVIQPSNHSEDVRGMVQHQPQNSQQNIPEHIPCPKCGGRGSYHCPQMLGTVECECTLATPQPPAQGNRIVPVLPVRDEYGFWQHPNRIETPFDEGGASTRTYEAWFAERGMAVDFTYMNQVFCEDCCYGENVDNPALHWNPESPYGDGWILTAIFDTEEGPCAEWVRYTSPVGDKGTE